MPSFLAKLVAACPLVLVLVCIIPGRGAIAQQLSEYGPYLQIETGEHEGTVNALAELPDGTSFISVSDDKTARIWSNDTLAPPQGTRVLHPPVGPKDDGKLYAVAASGTLIALGGVIPDGHLRFAVELYRLPTMLHYATIAGMAAVRALKFSPDGRYLAIGFEGGAGIIVFDMRTHRIALVDRHNARGMAKLPVQALDSGYAGDVTGLAFDRRDRLAVAADGKIRLYRSLTPSSRPLLSAAIAARGVAFSPDGSHIAVGDRERDEVHILDGASLRQVGILYGAPGRYGSLGTVAYSADGAALFAAGTYKDAAAHYLVRRWQLRARSASDTAVAGNTIMDLLPLGNDVIFASADPSIGRIAGAGHLAAIRRSHHIDFRNAGLSSFAASEDGSVVRFPGGRGRPPLLFDLLQRTLTPATAADVRLFAPQDHGPGPAVTDWRNSRTPRVNGRLIGLTPSETARAVAVSPTGRGVAIGTDFYVRYETPAGEAWKVVTPATAWAVAVSGDGRLVVAALADGTVHWYDTKDGAELLGLFVDPFSRTAPPRWVLWTPRGYFDHDQRHDGWPDGRYLVGYVEDAANWKTTRFVQIGQMYSTFFRPDLVSLQFRDQPTDRRTIKEQLAANGTLGGVIARGLPPQVTLLDFCGHYPDSGASGCPSPRPLDTTNPADHPGVQLATTAGTVIVKYRLDARQGGVGKAIIERDGAVIRPDIFPDEQNKTSETDEATIPLGAGLNDIQVIPTTASGDVQGIRPDIAEVKVFRLGPVAKAGETRGIGQAGPAPTPAAPAPVRPTLYMLSVGISNYDEPSLSLPNPADDARAMAELMDTSDPPVYYKRVVKTLIDGQATRSNIVAALQEIGARAGPDDLVVIFFAGHGQQVSGKYYFAPVEFGKGDPAVAGSESALNALFVREGLGPNQLLPLIQSINAAHIALFLDTCFSAAIAVQDAVNNRTVSGQIGEPTGRFVLSSSINLARDSAIAKGRQPADAQGHGIFTAYLLQALQGRADLEHTGQVDIDDVEKYTQRHVQLATAGSQEPWFYYKGNDFFALRAISAEP